MRVAVDLDGVVVDFVGSLLRQVWCDTGVELQREQVTEWDPGPLLDPVLGRPWMDWLRERCDEVWGLAAPLVPNAVMGVRLLALRHDVEILTVKPDWAVDAALAWARWHLPDVPLVIVPPGERKTRYAPAAQLLIDDNPEECLAFARSGRRAMLYNALYNRNAPPHELVRRVRSWPEIIELLMRRRTT